MNESLRPLESSSIDEGLRTRLEGDVELLEDSLALFSSVASALVRKDPTCDDIQTLQECVLQLPRIDAALDHAGRYEPAGSLVRAVTLQKKEALAAAAIRLPAPPPSLRDGLSQVIEQLRTRAVAPSPGERVLASSRGAPWVLAFVFGAFVTWVGTLIHMGTTLSALVGALIAIAVLRFAPERSWMLFPDRLYFPSDLGRPAKQLLPGELESLALKGSRVEARWKDDVAFLDGDQPKTLAAMLTLMKGPWLRELESKPTRFVVLDAVNEKTMETGRALVWREGVLFVPKATTQSAIAALSDEQLPEVPLEAVLSLVAHVPQGRVDAVAQRLAQAAEVVWIPRDGAKTERSENERLAATLTNGEKSVKVLLPPSLSPEQRQDANALLF